MVDILINTINLLFTVLMLLILARVILSWLPNLRYNQIGQLIFQLSEPILAPFHRFIPPMGMLDITPMVAIIVLSVLQQVLIAIIASIFSY